MLSIINQRYQLLKSEFTDSYGIYYTAYDLKRNKQLVTLKLLNDNYLDVDLYAYYSKNFLKMTALIHPNINRALRFDVVTTSDNQSTERAQYFYTLEHLDLDTMLSYDALSAADQLLVIRQLFYGVRYLHFKGYQYGHLTEDNILIHRDDDGDLIVKLRELPSVYDQLEEKIIGAVKAHYLDGVINSDIYHLSRYLKDYLDQTNPDADLAYPELYHQLSININEIDKPELHCTLEQLIAAITDSAIFGMPFWDRSYYEMVNFNAKLISRQGEIRQMMLMIDSHFKDGKGMKNIIVTGEAGVGKSRFIQEIIFLQRTKRRMTLVVDIVDMSDNPYRLLAMLINSILKRGEIGQDYIDKYGEEIVKVLPQLISHWDVLPSQPLSQQNEILKINNRLVQFILEYCQAYEVIITIENIDLLNDNEAAILNMLISAQSQRPLVLVGTALSTVSNEQLPHQLSITERLEVFNLARLNYDDIVDYLREFFGIEEDVPNFAELIEDVTFGTPRTIVALIKHLVQEGIVYVNEDRKWHIGEIKPENIAFVKHLERVHLNVYQRLDQASQRILQILSLFDSHIDRKLVQVLAGYDRIAFDISLNKLLEVSFVRIEKLMGGDRLYLSNREIKKVIYDTIAVEQRLSLHAKVAKTIEQHYIARGEYRPEYINHLIQSSQLPQAMLAAVSLAGDLLKRNLTERGIKYYEMALELAYQIGDMNAQIELLSMLANTKLILGDVQAAQVLYELLLEKTNSEQEAHAIAHIDCQIKLVELKLRNKSLKGIEAVFDDILTQCKAHNYTEGILQLGVSRFSYYNAMEDESAMNDLIEEMVVLAKSENNPYFLGRYEIIQGVYYDEKRDYRNAFRCFKAATSYLNPDLHPHELSVVFNNLGVLSYEILGDIDQAKDYFNRALDLLIKAHITIDRNQYLNNLGEANSKQGNAELALKAHGEALRISRDTRDIDGMMTSLSLLIETNVQLSRFDWANQYLIELEEMLLKYNDTTRFEGIERARYAVSLYYLKVNHRENARFYFDDIVDMSMRTADHLASYRLHIHKLRLDYFFSDNRTDFYVDYTYLKQLRTIVTQPVEEMFFKELMLDIILDMMCFDNREQIVEAIEFYRSIGQMAQTEIMDYKEELFDLYLNQSVDIVDHVLDSAHFQLLSTEDQWKLNVVVANYYALCGDYYKGLRYYMEAIDTINSLYVQLEEDIKPIFIKSDALKANLYACVDILLSKIDDEYNRGTPFTVENFLNIEPLASTLDTAEFKSSILQTYGERFGVVFHSADDLIQKMTVDQEENIRLVLQYICQSSLADRGYLLMLNDEGAIEEWFGLENEAPEKYVNRLIAKQRSGHQAKISKGRALLSEDVRYHKATMLIPVRGKEVSNEVDDNRRQHAYAKNEYPVAYLYFYTDSRLNNFNEDTLAEIASLNALLYLIIDNYQLYKTATIDKLTGVYLRKHFETQFSRQIEDCRRLGESLSVVMLDIDHFKVVNDTFGHRRGDEVLRKIAAIIRDSVRSEDLVGRYGGEEFIVLLPTAKADKAYQIVERIRQNIEGAKILGDNHPVTVSAGIAVYPQMGTSQGELIDRADQALYESKNTGRNKTTVYNSRIKRNNMRYDKLSGILTGVLTRDARVLKAYFDMMDVIALQKPLKQKLAVVLKTSIDIFEALDATVVLSNGEDHIFYIAERNRQKLQMSHVNRRQSVIDREILSREGYFIKWDDLSDIDPLTNKPIWKSHIQCPVVSNGETIGNLAIRVPIKEREFSFSDYNLATYIAKIISAMIN